MNRRFQIVPPKHDPRIMLALVSFGPLLVLLAAAFLLMKPPPPALLALPILAIVAMQVVFVSRWAERIEVRLDGEVLRIVAGLSKLEIAADEIDLDQSRVLRLEEHVQFKPFFKTVIRLPGLALGWTRSRSLLRLFCVLTDRERVLVLPARDGKQAIVLSLEHPDDLLAALRDAVDRSRMRR